MTLLCFSSFLWLCLPKCLQSSPAIADSHANSALFAVNWLSALIKTTAVQTRISSVLASTEAAAHLSCPTISSVSLCLTSAYILLSGICLVLSVFAEMAVEQTNRKSKGREKIRSSKTLKWFSFGNCSDW